MSSHDGRSSALGVVGVVLAIASVGAAYTQFRSWRTLTPGDSGLELVFGSILLLAAFLFGVLAVRGLHSSFAGNVVLELGAISLGVIFAIAGGYYLFVGLFLGRSIADVLFGTALFGTSIAFYILGFAAIWLVGASERLESTPPPEER